jgi:hypothetical protein
VLPIPRHRPAAGTAEGPRLLRHLPSAGLVLSSMVLFPPGSLAGQSVATAPPPSAAAATATLVAGAPVRVAVGGVRVTGRVQGVSPDTLVLAVRDGTTARLAIAGVDTVWHEGRATGRGAAIGAVIGGVTLAGFGAFVASALCESSDGCTKDVLQVGLAGGAMGAAGGALLGAGIGSLARTWRRVAP